MDIEQICWQRHYQVIYSFFFFFFVHFPPTCSVYIHLCIVEMQSKVAIVSMKQPNNEPSYETSTKAIVGKVEPLHLNIARDSLQSSRVNQGKRDEAVNTMNSTFRRLNIQMNRIQTQSIESNMCFRSFSSVIIVLKRTFV
jgi:hypothetical protein